MGRQNKSVTPGGTITRTVFDARGHALADYVGTDDSGATDADPTGAEGDPHLVECVGGDVVFAHLLRGHAQPQTTT